MQQKIPMFQYDKHTLHCVLGSVSRNSHNSMFPTSRIICFDSGLKGLKMIDSVVHLFEEHVDLGGSQFSESIVERWYFARVSTTKCGSPGIRKSMSTSFTIIGS